MNLVRIRLVRQCLSLGAKCFIGSAQAASPIAIRESVSRKTPASDNAKFGQPETGLGILPGFGGTQRLARLVGKGRAKELIFTCDMIDANEAYRIGLANKVVPQAELLDTCKAMAEKIMSKGSYAISLAKEAINTGTETDLSSGLTLEADLFGLAFSTDDKKEGMTAFLEKRKANLTDF